MRSAETAVSGARTLLKHLVAGAKRDSDKPDQMAKAGYNLLKEAQQSLQILDMLLPQGHPVAGLDHDAVALAALDLSIGYVNATKDWRGTSALMAQTLKVGRGKEAKRRIQENLSIVWGNLGRRW